MKMFEFQLEFHLGLFLMLRYNYQYSSIGSDNSLVTTRRQTIIWTYGGKVTDVYMRHSASMS